MGIFDRFRATAPSGTNGGKPDTSEQDATRLIDEGHVLETEGKLDEAMQRYLDAIRLAPNPARAHLNQGNVLLLKGDLKGALDAFSTAIKHQPDYAGAYYNIGNALLRSKQLDEAIASFRKALEFQPDYAEVHCSLGVALKELGQIDSAIAFFQTALGINPDLTEAQTNLGLALQDSYNTGNLLLNAGKLEDAVANFRIALKIEPNLAEAHDSLGRALQALGQPDNAVASFHRALEINPDYAEAHNNLGSAIHELEHYEKAMASYRRAIGLKPDYAEAHNNLGIALKDLGQLDGAVASYRQALKLKPDYAEVHTNLGNVLQELGQLDSATASYRLAMEIKPDYLDAHQGLLFSMNYSVSHSPSYYLELARQYGRVISAKPSVRFSAWQCEDRPKRLRVGMVSGDLRMHSVGHFLEGLLAHIDPARTELIAYPTHHEEDELTERIQPYFSLWQPLFGRNNETAARLIHSDGVHVLIDLSGHTGHNRLPVFAQKPAPIQVTWLGLPNTTGVAEMDYVLGDPHSIPVEFDNHFSEAVWRMPESYLCLTVPASSVKVAPLPARSTGYVTFGSFNNLTKMTDAVVAVWARILKSVPNSQLLLKTKQLNDLVSCEKTRQRFAACGITPDRLILGGTFASRDDHLAAYNKVDIALDTFPYPGVTTSAEALWMGVPVLSMQGDRFMSCTAGSIAHNAGLPDWIAANQDDYVAKAVAFASNLEHMAALRAVLREQVLASPLFDAPRFARNFEDALWGMWQRYQAQQGKHA